nr:hypothetical protein [Tanacetum cinerariifolium]
MNQAAIRQLIDDRVAAALKAKAANIENADNTNRNREPREVPIARKLKKFPLPEYFPTASEDRFPLLSEGDAPAEEVCTADEVK